MLRYYETNPHKNNFKKQKQKFDILNCKKIIFLLYIFKSYSYFVLIMHVFFSNTFNKLKDRIFFNVTNFKKKKKI